MQSIFTYLELSVCAVIAFTHKSIALMLIGMTDIPYTPKIQTILQCIVLILTGIGAAIRIYKDLKPKK